MRGDGLLIGVDLTEQEGLDEAPGGDEGMSIVERSAEGEGLEHIALEVDVALQISLGDVALIESAQGPDGPVVAQADAKLGLALADVALLPVRQLDREGRRHAADAIEKGVEGGCSG